MAMIAEHRPKVAAFHRQWQARNQKFFPGGGGFQP